jgi:hypothetical protein
LLQGFVNVEAIEPAVMEQYEDFPEDKREEMRQQLRGKSFYNDIEE